MTRTIEVFQLQNLKNSNHLWQLLQAREVTQAKTEVEKLYTWGSWTTKCLMKKTTYWHTKTSKANTHQKAKFWVKPTCGDLMKITTKSLKRTYSPKNQSHRSNQYLANTSSLRPTKTWSISQTRVYFRPIKDRWGQESPPYPSIRKLLPPKNHQPNPDFKQQLNETKRVLPRNLRLRSYLMKLNQKKELILMLKMWEFPIKFRKMINKIKKLVRTRSRKMEASK